MEPATFDLELGRSILDGLRAQDITLVAAADRTGIPVTTLDRHLKRGGITAREAHALAALLDTSVSELAAGVAA